MSRFARLVILLPLVAIAMLAPPPALAHEGAKPFVHAPGEGIRQGEPFTVIGSDLGERARVTLDIVLDSDVIAIGTVQADDEGHFETMFILPDAVPRGYQKLRARGEDGTETATWILVGDGPDTSSPAGSGPEPWLIDPSLALLLAGAAILVGVRLGVPWRQGSR
jgi:hypothetical protein